MSPLHNKRIRLATWMGRDPAAIEQRAFIEHALDHARSWVQHGQKQMQMWRLEQLAKHFPTQFGAQAG